MQLGLYNQLESMYTIQVFCKSDIHTPHTLMHTCMHAQERLCECLCCLCKKIN